MTFAQGVDAGGGVSQLIQTLQQQNAIQPSGTVNADVEKIAIRVSGQFTSEESLKAINFQFNGRFFRLNVRMSDKIAGLNNARAQMFAMLRAYIQHGVENPALYRLMFGGYLTDPDHARPAIERAAAEKTKALLARLIVDGGLGRAIPNTPRNERKIDGAVLACWSLVHGLTLLLADGLVGPTKKSAELGESLVQGMLDGLAAKLPALPAGTWVGPSAD